MSQRHTSDRTRRVVRTGLALATTLFPLPLLAQAEAPAAPAAESPAPAVAAAEPSLQQASVTLPAPTQVAQVVAAPAAAAAPAPTVTEAAPPAAEDAPKPLEVNVWGRIGNSVRAPKGQDTTTSADAEVNLLLNGRIHPMVGWTADFVATYGPGVTGPDATASILDLIAKFELHDAFNVWFGRMLVPSDRSNFSGPWFMSPWNYPGFFQPGPPIGPKQGAFGRNDGATVWGQFGGGVFKYYAGVFDLTNQIATTTPGMGGAPATTTTKMDNPLLTSRINISLINPEPGFYHSSTYYGGKDVLAIGLSAQYKKDGALASAMDMAPSKDYTGFSADVLFEKNLGVGTIDLEGAFYAFSGDYNGPKNMFYALASYLLPGEIGIGKLQPLVRWQQASFRGDNAPTFKLLDAQIGYAIKEYAARVALGYQRYDLTETNKSNAFILGIQLQK